MIRVYEQHCERLAGGTAVPAMRGDYRRAAAQHCVPFGRAPGHQVVVQLAGDDIRVNCLILCQ